MKKLCSILLASWLAFPAVTFAASFEGTMHIKMSTHGKDQATDLDYQIKNSRARITMLVPTKKGNEPTSMVTLFDYTKLEMVTLIPDQKTYMVMPIKSVMDVASDKAEESTLEKTGEKEKILGYTCEKYRVKSAKSTSEMWVTEDLGTFAGFANMSSGPGKGATSQSWAKLLAGKNMFPLRVVGLSPEGKETFRMEVTAVKKESVPESAVTPPADYQRMDLPDMGGMMKGMMKGFGR